MRRIGQKSRLRNFTRNKLTGVLGDPVTLTLTIVDPLKVKTVYTFGGSAPQDAQLQRIAGYGAGAFELAIIWTLHGTWTWRWEGVGGVEGAAEGQVPVARSLLAA